MTIRCRRCGEPLTTGLVATDRRHCCLNDTPIAGACPNHGPVGPHDAVEAGDVGSHDAVEESGVGSHDAVEESDD